jgi:hypothetical protein
VRLGGGGAYKNLNSSPYLPAGRQDPQSLILLFLIKELRIEEEELRI